METKSATTKDRIAEKVGYGLTDRLIDESRMAERARCGQMLDEFIAQGRNVDEIVAYARALLRTDY